MLLRSGGLRESGLNNSNVVRDASFSTFLLRTHFKTQHDEVSLQALLRVSINTPLSHQDVNAPAVSSGLHILQGFTGHSNA